MSFVQIPFRVLRAAPDQVRGEVMNYGVVAFTPDGPNLRIDAGAVTRLRALHPNYARWNADAERDALWAALVKAPDVEGQEAILAMMCGEETIRGAAGCLIFESIEDVASHLSTRMGELMTRYVSTPLSSLPMPKKIRAKPASRLHRELRDWFKRAKAFSTNMDDLSKNRVVANYPISVAQDLYADFAVKNGQLHVMETLDLRGVEKLTPALRGEAAVKGITLDEARDGVDGCRIAVVRASDYSVARPALRMIQRYASDIYELDTHADRQRFADFLHRALHRELLDMPT